jgi:hypothetical protein
MPAKEAEMASHDTIRKSKIHMLTVAKCICTLVPSIEARGMCA